MSERWITENLHAGFRSSLKADEIYFESETGHQHLVIFKNERLGRVMCLDGVVQVTEADEFVYHEMLAHTPILAHGAARQVLIIGGGDGGMAREVLRHPGVEGVTMVEIDASVVELSKKHLPMISAGAFDDPRLELVFNDGAAFVRDCEKRYDVAIIDSTDPIGPGETLFTETFYANVKSCLNEDGIVVTQNGVPFVQAGELRATMAAFRKHFAAPACYLASVPMYLCGNMAFAWGSDNHCALDIAEADLAERYRKARLATRYYTPAVHKAAFALPPYIDELTKP